MSLSHYSTEVTAEALSESSTFLSDTFLLSLLCVRELHVKDTIFLFETKKMTSSCKVDVVSHIVENNSPGEVSTCTHYYIVI